MGKYGVLETTTIRDFTGGLNVVTNDLNMSTNYSKVETNMFNNINGTKSKRYGTRLWTTINSDIVVEYDVQNSQIASIDNLQLTTTQPSVKIPVGNKVKVSNNASGTSSKDFEVAISSKDSLTLEINESFSANQTVYLTYSIKKYQKGEIVTTEYKNIPVTVTNSSMKYYIGFDVDNFPKLSNTFVGSLVNFDGYDYRIKRVSNNFRYIEAGNPFDRDKHKLIIHFNNTIGTRVINSTYFSNYLISVTEKGEVIAFNGEGYGTIIFNDAIASTVNKEVTAGWSKDKYTSVCFTVFNGILTIWNGIDKPLFVDFYKDVVCNFLIDEGTMSNAFIPRAKYALAFNHYLVVANIVDDDGNVYRDRVSISSRDTIGTFYSGDTDDVGNDAVYEDLGKIISSNNQEIKGLSRYRNEIVIGFPEVSVFGTLGKYEEITVTTSGGDTTKQIHTPAFDDVVDNHGCISHRTYMPMQSELVCLDFSGLPDFRRGNLSSTVIPSRISQLIAPELYKQYIGLTESAIEDRVFAVNNPKDNQYLLFIPNNSDAQLTTETVCYAYTLRNGSQSSARDGAWSKFTGWNFEWGCTSALNTVFLGHNERIYVLGNIDDPIYADYEGDPEYPIEFDGDVIGKAIDFDWEFPWAEFGDRTGTKYSRYLALSTNGIANFTVDFYTDYIYTDVTTGDRDPQLTMDFVAGDSAGWGNGLQYYGAGRRTNTEKLFAWTAPFKIGKFRLYGSSKHKLNINNITLYFQRGNIRR